MIRAKLSPEEVDICRRIGRERNDVQNRKHARTLRVDAQLTDEEAHSIGTLGEWTACKMLHGIQPAMPPVRDGNSPADAVIYLLPDGRRMLVRTRPHLTYDLLIPADVAEKKFANADIALLCEVDARWITDVNMVGYCTKEEWNATARPLLTGKARTLMYPRRLLHPASDLLPPPPAPPDAPPAPAQGPLL